MRVRKRLGAGAHNGLGVLQRVVGQDDRRGTTELGDGIGDAYAFSKGDNADLGFEEVDIELEEDVARDFLL